MAKIKKRIRHVISTVKTVVQNDDGDNKHKKQDRRSLPNQKNRYYT